MTTRSPEDLATRLFEAIEEASAEDVQKLLDEGADPDSKQELLDDPALKLAVESESLEIVEKLVKAGAIIDATSSGGETALTEAARTGRLEIVKFLLKLGANPNLHDKMNMTPLHWAIHWSRINAQSPTKPGYIETVQQLIAAGADVNCSHSEGTTPLMMAARQGDEEMCRILMKAGADKDARNREGQRASDMAMERGFVELAIDLGGNKPAPGTPLHLFASVRAGSAKDVKSAIDSGVDVNARDRENCTALIIASEKGQPEIVKLLIKAGADLEATVEKNGATPLLRALWNRHREIAGVLLDAGADVHARNDDSISSAAGLGYDDIVRILIKKGVDPDSSKGRPLLNASEYGYTEVIKALLEAGANPDVKGEYKETPLIKAARAGQGEAVQALIKGGAALDAKSEGWTALIWGAERGHSSVVRLLMEAGAKITGRSKLFALIAQGDEDASLKTLDKEASADVKDSTAQWSALTWCALLGREKVLEALLARGAAPGSDNPYYAPLVCAARLGRTGTAKLLLRAGALTRDPKSMIPSVMEAASNGHGEILRLLISAGADVNCRDRGWTPLMRAAEKGHIEAVRALIEGGADVTAKTALGLTAADEAAMKEHPEVEAFLKEAALASRERLSKPQSPPTECMKEGIRDKSLGKDLLAAILAKSREEVKSLLKRGADPDVKDDRGRPAGVIALEVRDTEILKDLLEAGADSTQIFKSIPLNDSTMLPVELLIQRGADVNTMMANGITPLMMAASSGNPAMVTLLLKEGADVNAQDDRGCTALFPACGRGHEEITLALLDAGANPAITVGKDSPLFYAARARLPRTSRKILALLYRGEDKKFGIFRHIADGNVAEVTSRLDSGMKADVSEPLTKWPALFWASLLGETEIAKRLIAGGADVNGARNGWRPLSLACAGRNPELCEALLGAGADPDIAAGPNAAKLLPHMASLGDRSIVKLLINAGSKVDTAVNQSTSLHNASQRGDLPMMTTLSDAGANLEAKDYHKATPLILSIKYGHGDGARLLLERGAKADVKLNDRPLLSWMASIPRAEGVRLLLEHGSSANSPDAEGRTPLHYAASACAGEAAELLISAGAKANARSARGSTPLLEAARVGSISLIRKLLDSGADPRVKNVEGRMAIDEAALEGEINAVRLLSDNLSSDGSPRIRLWRAISDGDGGSLESLMSETAGDLCGISPLRVAVMMGVVESAQALLKLNPDSSEIDGALSAAVLLKDTLIEKILRDSGGAHKRPAPSGPSARTIDAVMKNMPSFDHPVIHEGKWSRFLQAPDDLSAQGAMRHQWTAPFSILAGFDDMDSNMRDLGFKVLGNLVCERIRDVQMRCYSSLEKHVFAIWNVGIFNQSVDMACPLSDGAGIVVTNLQTNNDNPGQASSDRSFPDASMAVLAHKLNVWFERFRARGIAPGKRIGDLPGIAAHLDNFLVKRFSQ